MNRITIKPENLTTRIHHLWNNQWLLLSCGDFKNNEFNCMTVGWGSIGTMWSQPFVQVVVRPTRFTHRFMEKYPDFTLSAFPKEYRKDLSLLGSISGRDGDKLSKTALTPISSKKVASPSYDEAELIIECRKIYRSQFKPEQFLDPKIEDKYPEKNYHIVYFGQIVHVQGIEKYHVD